MKEATESAGQLCVRHDRRRIAEQKKVRDWESSVGIMLGPNLRQLSYSKKLLLSRYDQKTILQISEFLDEWFRVKRRSISYRRLKTKITELEE